MDYKKIYDNFIISRRAMPAPTGYSESHHITPRAFGGQDTPENLIRLNAREHYFAHCCLAKIHGGEMWTALHLMSHTQKTQHGAKPFLRGRMFAVSRERAATVRSENMTEAWASGEFKRSRIYGPTTAVQRKAAAEAGRRPRENKKAEIEKAIATKQAKARTFDFIELATGRTFRGTELEFRRVSGVGQSHSWKLASGGVEVAKGWVLAGNENKPRGNRDRTVRVFRHRDGRVFEGTAYDFNAAHIQDSGMLSNCINGKNGVKSARGWLYAGEK